MNKYIAYFLSVVTGRRKLKQTFLFKKTPDFNDEAVRTIIKTIDFSQYEPFCDDNSLASQPNSTEKINVFAFWYDGWESLKNKVVLKCKENLLKYYGANSKYNVVLLDKNNILDYVNADDILLDQFLSQKITIQQLSDLLRLCLLYKRGGFGLILHYCF